MASGVNVSKVFDNNRSENTDITDQEIIKSENDAMEYRLITLDNGLKAMLVSDVQRIINLDDLKDESNEEYSSESEQSSEEHIMESDSEGDDNKQEIIKKKPEEKIAACALCVGVGSFSDPPDIPGLAHFLEHMVFMGSEKYPQENGFDEFIKKYGGSDNGSTDCETTTFYLECNEKYLKEGMDRFAQFFIAPLMVLEAMTREREAMHSEFEMSLPSDGTRREQILGSLSPPGHPAGKFLWGNLTTLKDNIDDDSLYKRVHEFQKRHYSAHRMTVAVQARLSLDTLEEYVRKSFSGIPCNNLPPENFASHVGSFGTNNEFNKVIWIKPVKDICQIHLTWVLPSYSKEYKSKPLEYVGWLIGHEGEGSLLSYLRKKVWALQCEAGNDETGFELNSIYSLFSISLTLTEDGYKHINEVIALVFTYIALLVKNCPNKKIYDELRKICEINFRYKAEIPSASYVEILAESMQMFEPKHYIAGGELYLEYKPEVIEEILNLLTPERVNIIVYSKEKEDNFYDRTEPWFQTKHRIEEIPPEWKKSWHRCFSENIFHMPLPNPYLTNDFSLLEEPEFNPPYPEKILDDSLLEIWYRQDTKFKQPLAYYSFYMISPLLKSNSMNCVLLDLLSAFMDMKFTEFIFPAIQAGLGCTFSPADLGLSLHFSGYNEKLPLFFDEVLKLIRDCILQMHDENNETLFSAIKRERSRCYYNRFLKPGKLVKMARLSLLVENYWTSVEYLSVLNEITLEELSEFSNQFFHQVRILGLIQGNISKENSLELCKKFRLVLECSPIAGQKPQISVTKLDEGETFLRLKSFNEVNSNSVITNYYQIGPGSIKTSCLIDLLMMIMDEPLFDNLRTKQQLGYDVECSPRNTFGILAFSLTIFFQSSKFHADEVDERIELFLTNFLKTLRAMPKKEWEETKSSLCLLKSNSDLQLLDEVKRNFSEICSYEGLFDRTQKEIETIPTISQKELCAWFADHIISGSKFKKLSVQVLDINGSDTVKSPSKGEENPNEKTFELNILTSDADEKKRRFITDIVAFKNSRKFYPPRE